jgi:hypothetical protein
LDFPQKLGEVAGKTEAIGSPVRLATLFEMNTLSVRQQQEASRFLPLSGDSCHEIGRRLWPIASFSCAADLVAIGA